MEILDTTINPESATIWATYLLAFSMLLGIFSHNRYFWRFRKLLTSITIILIACGKGFMLVSDISPAIIVLLLILLSFRLFSLLRIIKDRINHKGLRKKSLRTESMLSTFIILLLIAEQNSLLNGFVFSQWVIILSIAQLLIVVTYLLKTSSTKKSMEIHLPAKLLPDSKLPTVTVAIPARNETTELNYCLQSLLKSDYPKLEIIVLDDCSHTKTSDIIKKFAHSGVRFILGKPPSKNWLSKNFAYQQLLSEAEGEYVIFCGSDIRFKPNSIRTLITSQIRNEALMISLLPSRQVHYDSYFIFQPLRYWREIAIPHFNKQPPALSSCWSINRSFFIESGGFKAFKKTIRPERVLSTITEHTDHYMFLRSSLGFGISSTKSIKSQWGTAIRTRYPELKNQPESVLFATSMIVLVFIGTPVVFVYSVLNSLTLASILSGAALLSILYLHYSINKMSEASSDILRFLFFPITIFAELVSNIYSMWAYEFSYVKWRGRNICLPVLDSNLKLPKLDN